MCNVVVNKQLTRLGYDINNLRNESSFDLLMVEGTCILTNNNVLFLGEKLTGVATVKKTGKYLIFTNDESVKNLYEGMTDSNVYTSNFLNKNGTKNPFLFFCSLLELLIHKSLMSETDRVEKQEQYKAAVLHFTGDTYSIDVSLDKEITAKVNNLASQEVMIVHDLLAIKNLLHHVNTLISIDMVASTSKGCRKVTIEGILPYIFKELFFYLNKTIVAEYIQDNGYIKKLFIFDKCVVEVAKPNGNNIAIITYSINKLPDDYPSNIYLESISYKDLINNLEIDILDQGYTPVKIRR